MSLPRPLEADSDNSESSLYKEIWLCIVGCIAVAVIASVTLSVYLSVRSPK